MDQQKQVAITYLKQMIGPNAEFRQDQWEAIEVIAIQRKRALVVQATGWGKSMVYFLATKILRTQGYGLTIIISPLLSLMRNQILSAEKIGIRAKTIHSGNKEEWGDVQQAIQTDECDVLLISPERLANPEFVDVLLPAMQGKIGLLVIDEAHCISDWGHDFRPDYQRIVRILKLLPTNFPVLATTATANNRVVADIQAQLGETLTVMRGSMRRDSLRLQNLHFSNDTEKLAWLVENLPKFKGNGIIYCLTQRDTHRVADWLKHKGFNAEAYHASDEATMDRPALEEAFLNNQIDILVATVALGMGFDKPDIAFVIHYQRPGSVIAYYQQVGRAGRAIERSYGIILNSSREDNILRYFIESAFVNSPTMTELLIAIEENPGLGTRQLQPFVNARFTVLEKAIKHLELEGAIVYAKEGKKSGYYRTPNPWEPNNKRIKQVTESRWDEYDEMIRYVNSTECLMQFLGKALDDETNTLCGKCANCRGKGFSNEVSLDLLSQAEEFVSSAVIILEPRKVFPPGIRLEGIPKLTEELRTEPGRALCVYGEPGLGELVRDGKYLFSIFDETLLNAAVDTITAIWQPNIQWVASIPSKKHPYLVSGFAKRLAQRLNLPYHEVLARTADAPEQKTMQNSVMQANNVANSVTSMGEVPLGACLLVDDILDSGWTMAIAGALLKQKGCSAVYPFALAISSSRS